MKYLCLLYDNEQAWAALPKEETDAIMADYFAFTRPDYIDTTTVHGETREVPHVVAVRPGENGWHMYVERMLEARKGELAAMRHAPAR